MQCMICMVTPYMWKSFLKSRVSQNDRYKARLHEHQVPDSNLDHNPHGRSRGGLSLDLNPVCLYLNTTNLDQNPCVNGAIES